MREPPHLEMRGFSNLGDQPRLLTGYSVESWMLLFAHPVVASACTPEADVVASSDVASEVTGEDLAEVVATATHWREMVRTKTHRVRPLQRWVYVIPTDVAHVRCALELAPATFVFLVAWSVRHQNTRGSTILAMVTSAPMMAKIWSQLMCGSSDIRRVLRRVRFVCGRWRCGCCPTVRV